MLIVSANDAASVIADVGVLVGFVQEMNAKARRSWAAPAQTLPRPTACLITATCPLRRIWQKSPPPARRTRPLHGAAPPGYVSLATNLRKAE